MKFNLFEQFRASNSKKTWWWNQIQCLFDKKSVNVVSNDEQYIFTHFWTMFDVHGVSFDRYNGIIVAHGWTGFPKQIFSLAISKFSFRIFYRLRWKLIKRPTLFNWHTQHTNTKQETNSINRTIIIVFTSFRCDYSPPTVNESRFWVAFMLQCRFIHNKFIICVLLM